MERELEVLIDDYLDGRMSGLDRERFERRMETDPSVRARVVDATRSFPKSPAANCPPSVPPTSAASPATTPRRASSPTPPPRAKSGVWS
jgi:anti-sigma factor RsiW